MKTWPWLLSKKPFTTGVFQNMQFLAALFHQLITKKAFVVGALLAPGNHPCLKFLCIIYEDILVCTWHKVHMSVPGRHQLMYYFEKAAIGKVKRSLKTADACLKSDWSWIFPNQGKWDGGNCPAFIVFCVPFKPTTCTYNQVICWFSLNKISISGKATNSWRNSSCARVGCFRKNPDSCGTGPRC